MTTAMTFREILAEQEGSRSRFREILAEQETARKQEIFNELYLREDSPFPVPRPPKAAPPGREPEVEAEFAKRAKRWEAFTVSEPRLAFEKTEREELKALGEFGRFITPRGLLPQDIDPGGDPREIQEQLELQAQWEAQREWEKNYPAEKLISEYGEKGAPEAFIHGIVTGTAQTSSAILKRLIRFAKPKLTEEQEYRLKTDPLYQVTLTVEDRKAIGLPERPGGVDLEAIADSLATFVERHPELQSRRTARGLGILTDPAALAETLGTTLPFMGGAALAYLAGGPGAAFGFTFLVESQGYYEEIKDDLKGSGLPEKEIERRAVLYGNLVGIANAAIETLQARGNIKFIKGGRKAALRSLMSRAKQRFVAVGAAARELGRHGLIEGSQELAQAGTGWIGKYIASGTLPNSEDVDEAIEAALGAGFASVLIGGGGRIVNRFASRYTPKWRAAMKKQHGFNDAQVDLTIELMEQGAARYDTKEAATLQVGATKAVENLSKLNPVAAEQYEKAHAIGPELVEATLGPEEAPAEVAPEEVRPEVAEIVTEEVAPPVAEKPVAPPKAEVKLPVKKPAVKAKKAVPAPKKAVVWAPESRDASSEQRVKSIGAVLGRDLSPEETRQARTRGIAYVSNTSLGDDFLRLVRDSAKGFTPTTRKNAAEELLQRHGVERASPAKPAKVAVVKTKKAVLNDVSEYVAETGIGSGFFLVTDDGEVVATDTHAMLIVRKSPAQLGLGPGLYSWDGKATAKAKGVFPDHKSVIPTDFSHTQSLTKAQAEQAIGVLRETGKRNLLGVGTSREPSNQIFANLRVGEGSMSLNAKPFIRGLNSLLALGADKIDIRLAKSVVMGVGTKAGKPVADFVVARNPDPPANQTIDYDLGAEVAPLKAEVKPPAKKPAVKAGVAKAEPARPAGFKEDPTQDAAPTDKRGGFVSFRGPDKSGQPQKAWLDLEKTKSPNPRMENFFGRTNRLTSVKSKLKVAMARIKLGLAERFLFQHRIRSLAGAAYAADALQTMRDEVRHARAMAYQDGLHYIDGEGQRRSLDAAGLDLLRRKVFTEDLLAEAGRAETEANELLTAGADAKTVEAARLHRTPHDLTPQEFAEEKTRVDALIARVPSVADAYKMRQELWAKVGRDLARRGVISDEAAKNQSYVRHFVLDYMDKERPSGIGSKLKAPGRPYAWKRRGTRRDISTDFLAVEMRALSQIYRDNAIEDAALDIAKHYAVAKEEGKIPEGYAEWQYKRGNILYRAKTITDAEIAKIMEAGMSDPEIADAIGVPVSAMREALVMGGKKQTYLIPEWLAFELDNMPIQQHPGTLVSFATPINQQWKRWILQINPIRYNRRNMIGDAERVNASGRTHAFVRVPEATKALVTRKSPEAHPKAFENAERYGAVGSSLRHEMGDITKAPEFERFQKVANQSGWDKLARTLAWPTKKVGQARSGILQMTQFREDILRYAVYLDALDDVQAFLDTGKLIRHRFHTNKRVHELAKTDKYRAAAKISRETLGDYGAFTPWENDVLRNGLVLFYSWLKINTTFWPQAIYYAGKEEGAKAAGKIALVRGARVSYGVGKWVAKVSAFYALLAAWNNSDEEKRRMEAGHPWWLKIRPHLNLDGGVVYDSTALSDFLEIIGIEKLMPLMRRFEKGQLTAKEMFTGVMKIEAQESVNKVVQSLNPFLKAAYTVVSGRTTFPDIFEGRMFAKAFSSKAVANAVLDVLGTDTRKFVEVAGGRRSLREALAYYFSGSAYRPMTAEQLEKDITRAIKKLTLKRKSRTTGRGPGEPKKGKEAAVQELRNRLRGLRGE